MFDLKNIFEIGKTGGKGQHKQKILLLNKPSSNFLFQEQIIKDKNTQFNN